MSSVWAVVSVNKNKFTIINADYFIGYLNKKSRDIVTTYIYDEKIFLICTKSKRFYLLCFLLSPNGVKLLYKS